MKDPALPPSVDQPPGFPPARRVASIPMMRAPWRGEDGGIAFAFTDIRARPRPCLRTKRDPVRQASGIVSLPPCLRRPPIPGDLTLFRRVDHCGLSRFRTGGERRMTPAAHRSCGAYCHWIGICKPRASAKKRPMASHSPSSSRFLALCRLVPPDLALLSGGGPRAGTHGLALFISPGAPGRFSMPVWRRSSGGPSIRGIALGLALAAFLDLVISGDGDCLSAVTVRAHAVVLHCRFYICRCVCFLRNRATFSTSIPGTSAGIRSRRMRAYAAAARPARPPSFPEARLTRTWRGPGHGTSALFSMIPLRKRRNWRRARKRSRICASQTKVARRCPDPEAAEPALCGDRDLPPLAPAAPRFSRHPGTAA